MLARLSLLLALLAVAAVGTIACFSTIPPDPEGSPTDPGGSNNTASVTGVVSLFRGEGDWDEQPGWPVQVIWLAEDGTELQQTDAKTGGDNFYHASISNPRVASVRLAALKCSVHNADPPAPRFTCCLDPVPCPSGCESPWDTQFTHKVVLGAQVRQDHRVNCATD